MPENNQFEIPSTVEATLRNPKNWRGAGYELGLQYEPGSLSHPQRLQLFQSVWRFPAIIGWADRQQNIGDEWQGIDQVTTNGGTHYYGYMRLDKGRMVGCGSCFIESQEALWLVLYIPVGLLERIFPVKHPVSIADNRWRHIIDEALVPIARHVYTQFPYLLGAIGEEASSMWPLQQLISLRPKKLPICCLVPELQAKQLPWIGSAFIYPEGLYRIGYR